MTRKRLTVTQLAMELSGAGSKYPRTDMATRWALNGPIMREYWLRVARRAIRLERKS
ncbi:MAG TPA: hypothetical protein VJ801_13230 [Polyangia bacterium]|jgi:hypothetical protein|nr:hypothetical protein [Polyangia bacterium]